MPRKRSALFGLLTRARERRGIVLIMVLRVLMLLALVAASFTRNIRTEINLTRNLIDNAKAQALADAGVYRAILGLLDSDPEARWRADRKIRKFSLGSGTVRVWIDYEVHKFDMNGRDNTRLGRLVVGRWLLDMWPYFNGQQCLCSGNADTCHQAKKRSSPSGTVGRSLQFRLGNGIGLKSAAPV